VLQVSASALASHPEVRLLASSAASPSPVPGKTSASPVPQEGRVPPLLVEPVALPATASPPPVPVSVPVPATAATATVAAAPVVPPSPRVRRAQTSLPVASLLVVGGVVAGAAAAVYWWLHRNRQP
jgi:hypothetical protein